MIRSSIAAAIVALVHLGVVAADVGGSSSIYVNAKSVEVASLLTSLRELTKEEVLVSPALGTAVVSIDGEYQSTSEFLQGVAKALHATSGLSNRGWYLGTHPEVLETRRPAERGNNCPYRYSDARLAQEQAHPTGLRKCEPLEYFPLARLRIAGIVSVGNRTQALVVSPDGITWNVHAGNYLGQEFGRIFEIRRSVVDLREIKQREDGEWIEVFRELEPK